MRSPLALYPVFTKQEKTTIATSYSQLLKSLLINRVRTAIHECHLGKLIILLLTKTLQHGKANWLV